MTTSKNPFALAQHQGQSAPQRAIANTDQQRAVAEVQAGMMLAKMNPRNPVQAVDNILNACTRPGLAESATYTYAKGGSNVTGPSIRLAEAMAQAWGNLSFGIREIDQDNGESTVQAFCWDIESNVRREMTFVVPHIRFTKSGSRKIEDPREIYEHVANQGARRLRACILAVIPGDVTEAAVSQCEVTMSAQADTSPDAMKKMLDVFGQLGVSKEQIEKRIQRRIEAIQPAQVVALRKIHNSLKDGMSIPEDWFEVAVGGGVADINAKVSAKPQGDTTPPPPEDKKKGGQRVDVITKEKSAIDKLPTSLAVDKWRANNFDRVKKLGEEEAKLIMDHANFVYQVLSAEEERENDDMGGDDHGDDKLEMEV